MVLIIHTSDKPYAWVATIIKSSAKHAMQKRRASIQPFKILHKSKSSDLKHKLTFLQGVIKQVRKNSIG